MFHEPAFLERIEKAQAWWPYAPRAHELEAIHYRAKAARGIDLAAYEIEAVANAYQRMIRANPYDPWAHFHLARWHEEKSRYALRVQNFEQAKTDLEDAVKAVERGLDYCPASVLLLYNLGRWYRVLGKAEQARDTFLRAHLLAPRQVPVLESLAELELQLGHPKRARRYMQMAHQIAFSALAKDASRRRPRSGRQARPPVEPQVENGDRPTSAPGPVPQIPNG
jgi:tetratricopeptide (TPR) repeat protein